VNVPFDFVAGCETLPVGTYRVSCVSTDEAPPDFVIHSDDKGALLLPFSTEFLLSRQKLGFEGETTTMRATEEQERETFIAIKRTCQ
jgi:hypothetical protein